MPLYVTFLGIFALSAFGFPGTNSFVSEFLVLIAAFAKYPLVGAAAILGAILAAAYMLRLLQKMVWGRSDGHDHPVNCDKQGHRTLWDLDLREVITLTIPLFFVFWLGFYPKPLLTIMDSSVVHLLQQVDAGMQQGDKIPLNPPFSKGEAKKFQSLMRIGGSERPLLYKKQGKP
jgi:NADH-quinone oxidoreductase subunit M